MMRKVYIVRHGEPDFPGGVWLCIGCRTDLPLSQRGREQAAARRPFFESAGIDALWSSPLARARQTAQLMSGGNTEIFLHDGLREFDLGDWEGLTTQEIDRLYPGQLPERVLGDLLTPPGGENLEAAGERFENALRDILGKTRGTLAVTAHMGVTSAFLCRVTGTDPHQWHRFSHDYATVTELDFDGGEFSLVRFNGTGTAAS